MTIEDELFLLGLVIVFCAFWIWAELRTKPIVCRECEKQVCQCGYSLRGLVVDRGYITCPECGKNYRRKAILGED